MKRMVENRGAKPERRGAKPGERRGGKTVGTKDKSTLLRETRLADAMQAATDAIGNERIQVMTPLDVMSFVMRLMAVHGWWLKAAEIAKDMAPYVHPKLASTELNDKRSRPIDDYTDEELVNIASGFSERALIAEDTRAN